MKNAWKIYNFLNLNVIKHIWTVLQNSVLIDPCSQDREKLIAKVPKTRNFIPVDNLEKLIEFLPN